MTEKSKMTDFSKIRQLRDSFADNWFFKNNGGSHNGSPPLDNVDSRFKSGHPPKSILPSIQSQKVNNNSQKVNKGLLP